MKIRLYFLGILLFFTACSGKESGQFAAPEFLRADVAVKGAEASFVCELSGNRVEQCGIVLEDRLIEGKMQGQAFTVTAGGLETGRPSPEPRHRPLTVPATPFHVSALLYVGVPDFCPGLLLSFTRGKWGGFVKGAVSLASMQASYACYADGTTDSGYIWTTGKEAAKRFNISAGGVFSPLDFLSFYAGTGYGKRQLFWEDTTSQWASVQDRSVSGMALDAGVLYSWRHLSLMAGVSAIGFKTVCAELGVGYCF